MIHYDELIKAEKMGYFSDYETLLFARAKGGIKSVTGVLPLTFTAKGGNAVDWVISGNAQGVGERTENLFDVDDVTTLADVSNNKGVALTNAGYYVIKSYSSETGYFYGRVYENGSAIGSTYYIKAGSSLVTTQITLTAGQTLYLYDPLTASTSVEAAKAQISNYQIYVEYSSTAMPIAPSSYVPFGYEIPISCEHNISEDVTYDVDTLLGFNGETIRQPPYQTTSDFIAVTQQKIVLSGTSVNPNNKLIRVCQYDDNKIFLNKLDSTLYSAIDYSFTFTLDSQTKFIKYSFYKTDTDFVAKEVNDYTFYIGSTPLTAGQSISKTSTGQDIKLFEGENTVSTTLYNKPEMKIDYE